MSVVVKIALTNGGFVKVDLEDAPWLSLRRWHNVKQRKTFQAKDRNMNYMPRILLKPNKDQVVDHINHDGLDNRRSNLRKCSIQQNAFNMKPRGGTSKFKGVYKGGNKWKACIKHNYKGYSLGTFDTEIEAAKAYNKAALELFGEFALLNNI